MATRAVDSEASDRKSNLAPGESQYVSRKGCGDARNEVALSWLLCIMATSFVIHSEASSSPSSDDAKAASLGDEVAISLNHGAMELLPFNILPCC